MKTVWKWVIGVVVVLMVLALVVGGAFLLRNWIMNVTAVSRANRPAVQFPITRQPNTGKLPSTVNGTNGNGTRRLPGTMMPFANGNGVRRNMPMGGIGMLGLGALMVFGALVRGLISLGLLTLIVLAIIWLIRSLRKPAASAPAVVPSPAPAAPAVASKLCHKCNEPVQANWNFCPNCGKRQ